MPGSVVPASVISDPILFRPFTRESIQATKTRIANEKWKKRVKDNANLHPDPKLEEGMPLPIRLAVSFEADLIGVPLEDVDPYYRNQHTFVIVSQKGDIFRFSGTKAGWLLSPFNLIRRISIAVLTHGAFSLIIIFTILVNCGMMVVPSSPFTESTEVIFTAIYTFEAACKIFARGFILNKFTYLRDAWNWLDFVVVSLAYVTAFMQLGNLTVLRTFRVLRALKTVAIVPGLKTIVGAVIESVKNLRDVIILTVFSLSVFALMGLQLYMGVLTQKCVKNYVGPEEHTNVSWDKWNENEHNWYIPKGKDSPELCGNSTGAGKCPDGYICLQGYGDNPDYNYTSFDSFGWALLSAFRLMNQDSWENLYQQVLRCAGPWHITFFIVIIFMGSYYLINLILAIVAKSYDELQRKAFADEQADQAEIDALQAGVNEENEEREVSHNHENYKSKTPSHYSSKSSNKMDNWDDGEDTVDHKDVKSEGGESFCGSYYGRLRRSFEGPSQASRSLPSSPFYKGRWRQSRSSLYWNNSKNKKPLIVRSLMDAVKHLPFADDSDGVTPTSLHSGFESKYSSYTSHDYTNRPCGLTVQVQPITKVASLKRRIRRWSAALEQQYCDSIILDTIDESKPGNLESIRNGMISPYPKPPPTSSTGVQDIFMFNQMMIDKVTPQKIRKKRMSVFEQKEEEGWGSVIKEKTMEVCFKCVDIFCVWGWNILPWKFLQRVVACIVTDPFFELIMTLVIICNTIFLSLDHYGIDQRKTLDEVLKTGNSVFSTIFGIECALKLLVMGPVVYSQSGWNVFDFLIVTLSVIEMMFSTLNLQGIAALRSVRMLRVFKLAKSWPTLNLLISIMGKTLIGLGNLVFVLFIIVFIFAVTGKQLFGKNYYANQHRFPHGELPRWNFTDFSHSVMIIFRVLCGEWIDSMYDCMLVSGSVCIPFFLTTVICANLVVLNLFLALLLNSFGASNLSSTTIDPETNKVAEAFKRIGRFLSWTKTKFNLCITIGYRRVIQGRNRILEILKLRKPPPPKTEKKKRNRLAKTARLVLRSRKFTESEKRRESVTKEVEKISLKSFNSHTHYRKNPLAEQEDSSMASTINDDLSDDIWEDDMDNEDGEREEEVEETPKQKLKASKQPPTLADCLPSCFYKNFPVLTLKNSKFSSKWLKIRLQTYILVEHKYFQNFIVTMIIMSSLALALEDIHLPTSPFLSDILFYMDRIFTVVFFIEMILKWISLGFVKYFTNAWCWLDFTIVLLSLSNFIISQIPHISEIPEFKAMRTLRALRPLRAMSRIQGMRIVIHALIQAIPSIANVLLICLINWLVFAILGVQLFNGKFHKCIIPQKLVSHLFQNKSECLSLNYTWNYEEKQCNIPLEDFEDHFTNIKNECLSSNYTWNNDHKQCTIPSESVGYPFVNNKNECLTLNYTWNNSAMNFDHVGKAYLSLFQVATFKGWIPIMNDAVDSGELDEQPRREMRFYMYIYFVIFIIFGSFFTLNLFVGVIIDNFNAQKKKVGASMELFMTEDQKKYYSAMKKMGSKKPIKATPRPNWKPQAMVFGLVADKRFEMAIMVLIGLNMWVMTMDHYKQSKSWDKVLDVLNAIFIGAFTAECILKMIALRYYFFKDGWNLFDFVVVCISVSSLVLSDLIGKFFFVSPTLLRVVRMAKIGRILRLVKGARGIRTLLFALAMSLPALFNICLLLFLVMFIYAIFGMSFFMNVKLTGGLDEVYNFQTFGQSIILLFQMSTSAGWDSVLAGITNEDDCELPDSNLGKAGNCGSTKLGIPYLLSYLVISFLIVINVYIAVILENYTQATEEVEQGLTDDDYDAFYEIWAEFDPQGSQYIAYDLLTHFVDALEVPLQLRKPNKFNIITMDIPICKGERVHCVDVLDSLTRDFFARKGNVIEIDENLEMNQAQIVAERPGYELTSSTLWRQREDYCARLIQHAWRLHTRVVGDGIIKEEQKRDENVDSLEESVRETMVEHEQRMNFDSESNENKLKGNALE